LSAISIHVWKFLKLLAVRSSRIVVQRVEEIFCITEESMRIQTINVEKYRSIHNEEDVIGMETDGVWVPKLCQPGVKN
jgi:hypothetical protein